MRSEAHLILCVHMNLYLNFSGKPFLHPHPGGDRPVGIVRQAGEAPRALGGFTVAAQIKDITTFPGIHKCLAGPFAKLREQKQTARLGPGR
jgi:hypothetical protein